MRICPVRADGSMRSSYALHPKDTNGNGSANVSEGGPDEAPLLRVREWGQGLLQVVPVKPGDEGTPLPGVGEGTGSQTWCSKDCLHKDAIAWDHCVLTA
jgi:hypothetical protein